MKRRFGWWLGLSLVCVWLVAACEGSTPQDLDAAAISFDALMEDAALTDIAGDLCGNSVLDPGETCDPPSSCPAQPLDCGPLQNCWASSYNSNGYEVSVKGAATPSSCLNSWKGSPGHNDVILNVGQWASHPWAAVGCSARWDRCNVWFGELTDPNPYP